MFTSIITHLKKHQSFQKHWPILVILGVWFFFAHPYFIKGLMPFPSDYLVSFFNPWTNYFGMPVKNGAMPDVISQVYPWKQIGIDSWKMGQVPMWNPYQFAGTPLLANFQSSVFNPVNFLYFLIPFNDAWSITILLQPLLAGLFMYLFVRLIAVSKIGALIASISFMFCGFITVWMAYGTLGYAVLYLPLLLYGIEQFVQKSSNKSHIIIAGGVTLTLLSGHFQMSTYVIIVGLLYIIARAISQKKWRLFVSGALTIGAGVIISLPQILPTIVFYQQSIRSELFEQGGEIIPWNYLPTIIAPDFFGNPVTRNDHFGHYAEWSSYVGVIPLLLALFLFLTAKKTFHMLFFAFLGAASLLLAYNSPLVTGLMQLRLPVLSTSAASRIIILFSFSIAVLSGFGFDFLLSNKVKSVSWKQMILFLLLLLTIVGIVWLFLLSNNLLFLDAVDIERLTIAKRNFMLPSALFAGGIFFILLMRISNDLIRRFVPIMLLVATVFEMTRFSTKWMPFEPKEFVYPPIAPLTYLQEHGGNYRVFGNIGNEAHAPFKIQGIEGYDPLYIRRYGELIASSVDGVKQSSPRSVVAFPKNGVHAKRIVDLLGVRYILHSKGDGRNIWAFPYWDYPESIGAAVWSDEKYEIYENTEAFPRAYLVYNYIVEQEDQKVLDNMFDETINLRKTVILEEELSISIDSCNSEGSVQLTSYTPNKIALQIESDCPGILFLSDNYYPGWKARVNGEQVLIYRANYTFRAITIPSGKSTVEFTIDLINV